MKRKLAGAAITLLVAGLGAGCGGDDGGNATTSAAAPLEKPEFIARADRICQATDAQIAREARRLREVGSKSGTLAVPLVARFLKEHSVPAYEAMLGKLRALEPPVRDEKTIDGYVAALAGAIDAVKADPEKYSKNTSSDPFARANDRAKAYGMKVCGSV